MAFDFQRDFETPLVRDLTEGNLGGAEDFANAITDYYMSTVKKGLPQGVPPSLPAPGLNPIAPPPFVIGPKGIVPSQAKQKIFYETVKAYFLAKELSLDKGSIKGLKDSIKQTIDKAKAKKQEIESLIKQTKELAKEIKNTPIYIKEVIEGTKEVIQEEKDKVKGLFDLMTNLKQELKEQGIDEARFKQIFSQELQLVEQVSNFRITSFEDFRTIPDKVDNIKRTANNIKNSAGIATPIINSPADLERARAAKQNNSATDRGPVAVGSFTGDAATEDIRRAQYAQQDKINALKYYVANRVGEAALSIEQLSIIVIEPPRFINYIERVARKNPKASRLYRGLVKLDAVERFIKPQLKKLEVQINIKKKEIKEYIEPRVDSLKKKLEERTTEYSKKKKAGAKQRLYSKAQQRVKDFKKAHEEEVKAIKQEVQITLKAIRKANSIYNKSIALQQNIVLEFDSLKSELILLKQQAESGELFTKYTEAGKDLKAGLAKIRLSQIANTGSLTTITPADPRQEPTLKTENPGAFVQGYERQINSVGDLERTREMRRSAANGDESKIATPEQVYIYMNDLGLGAFADPVVTILAQAKTDVESFKRLFERRTNQYKTYMSSIQDLVAETNELLALLQELSESKGPVGKKIAWTKNQVSNAKEKVKYSKIGRYAVLVKISMQDLFNELVKRLDPLIKKATAWASRLYKKAKTKIQTKVEKFQKDIETYLINLIPLKGYQKKKLEDAENRKIIIEAKKQRIAEFKKTIKYYQKLGQYIGKASRGSQGLFTNIYQNKVFAYAQNQQHIKNIADGIFGYRMLEAGDDQAKIAGLKLEKDAFETQMKTIGVIDALINGLIILFKEIKKTPAGQRFLNEVREFTQALNNTKNQYAVLWSEFVKIFDSPPTTVKAIIAFIDDTITTDGVLKMLESTEVVTFLVKTERKYLGGVRAVLSSITDVSVQEAASQIETNIQNQTNTITTKSATKKGFEVLTQWNDVLNRRDSFVKFMLVELRKALDGFLRFLRSTVEVFIAKQKKKLQEKFQKKKESHELELDRIKERSVNVEAKAMSIAMGLAARLFWTGARWQGNTGSDHITLSIGPFKPMKALPEDGMTGLVKELSNSFEKQIIVMTGLIIPPANTGIAPIPFQGYK